MLLALGIEHARILAKHGMSKDDVRVELHRRMRLRFDTMGVAVRNFYRNRRAAIDVGPEVADIPYLDDPAQILILVAGGPGLGPGEERAALAAHRHDSGGHGED